MTPVKMEVSGDPIFIKRRIMPPVLLKPIRQAIQTMCEKGLVTLGEPSTWAKPIAIPSKADDEIARICGNHQLTLAKMLQRTCH